jgi:Ca2+-binding RTX toxin-like protein
MPPRPAILCAILTTATLSGPLTAAQSEASPSCHGQRPTMVGKPNQEITGTRHRDVILTHGAKQVRSLGGDDVICVDDHSAPRTLLDVGAGDDAVYVTDLRARVTYRSGLGSDTYQSAGAADTLRLIGDGQDRVSTGTGGDLVGIRTKGGFDGVPTVDLGPGYDILAFVGPASRGHFEGGRDRDDIVFAHKSHHVWSLDNVRGEARAGKQVRFRWHGFENFQVEHLVVPEIRFQGGSADENVGTTYSTRLVAHMGGGDDVMSGGLLDDFLDGGPGQDIAAGGPGTDTCRAEEVDECELTGRLDDAGRHPGPVAP